jgi:hypothetical protein
MLKIPGRIFRTIDFILPGQLGFSLLSSGVFGVASFILQPAPAIGVEKILCNAHQTFIHCSGRGIESRNFSNAHGNDHRRA